MADLVQKAADRIEAMSEADVTSRSFLTVGQLREMVNSDGLFFNQLIDELEGRWIELDVPSNNFVCDGSLYFEEESVWLIGRTDFHGEGSIVKLQLPLDTCVEITNNG